MLKTVTWTWGAVPNTYKTAAEISSEFNIGSFKNATISGVKISVLTTPGLMLYI